MYQDPSMEMAEITSNQAEHGPVQFDGDKSEQECSDLRWTEAAAVLPVNSTESACGEENQESGQDSANVQDKTAPQSSGTCLKQESTEQDKEDTTKGEKKTYPNRPRKYDTSRKPKDIDCSKCTFKCSTVVPPITKKELYDIFCGLQSSSRQKDFVIQNITEKATRQYVDDDGSMRENKKKVARKYFLPVNGQRVQVCNKYFCATLGIGNTFVTHALKHKEGDHYKHEGRSRGAPRNKIPSERIDVVKEHIQSFLAAKSVLVGKKPKQSYSPKGLNLSKMYQAYLDHCKSSNLVPVKSYMYSAIFKKDYPYLSRPRGRQKSIPVKSTASEKHKKTKAKHRTTKIDEGRGEAFKAAEVKHVLTANSDRPVLRPREHKEKKVVFEDDDDDDLDDEDPYYSAQDESSESEDDARKRRSRKQKKPQKKTRKKTTANSRKPLLSIKFRFAEANKENPKPNRKSKKPASWSKVVIESKKPQAESLVIKNKKTRGEPQAESLVIKNKKTRGEPQASRLRKTLVTKQPKFKDCSNCTFKCSTKVTEKMRKDVFRIFWNLENILRRKNFVCQNVAEKATRQYLDDDGNVLVNRQKVSRKYFLPVDGKKIQVCQKYFCAVLAVGNTFINNALKFNENGCYKGQMKERIPYNKTPAEQIEIVRQHVESLLTVGAPCPKGEASRLRKGFNVARMYRLYLKQCKEDNLAPVRCHTYRQVFKNLRNGSSNVRNKKRGMKNDDSQNTSISGSETADAEGNMLSHSGSQSDEEDDDDNDESSASQSEEENDSQKPMKDEFTAENMNTLGLPGQSSDLAPQSTGTSSTLSHQDAVPSYMTSNHMPYPHSAAAKLQAQSYIPNSFSTHPSSMSSSSLPSGYAHNSMQSHNAGMNANSTWKSSSDSSMITNSTMESLNAHSSTCNENLSSQNPAALTESMPGWKTSSLDSSLTLASPSVFGQTSMPVTTKAMLNSSSNLEHSLKQLHSRAPDMTTLPSENVLAWQSRYSQASMMMPASRSVLANQMSHDGLINNQLPVIPPGEAQWDVSTTYASSQLPPHPMSSLQTTPNAAAAHLVNHTMHSSTSSSSMKTDSQPGKKRPSNRKKERNPEQWKSNVAKLQRLRGEAHIGRHGKIIPAKQLKYKDCSKCSLKCSNLVSQEIREKLFKMFYSLENKSRQKDFVCQNVAEKKTRKYIGEDGKPHINKKQVARKYFLPVNGGRVQVCEKFFRATLAIGNGYINHALRHKNGGCYTGKEKRGGVPHNKTPDEQVSGVQKHIESVLGIHGNGKDSGPIHVHEDLNVAKMYRMYAEECRLTNVMPVKKHMYRLICKRYDLVFAKPPSKKSGPIQRVVTKPRKPTKTNVVNTSMPQPLPPPQPQAPTTVPTKVPMEEEMMSNLHMMQGWRECMDCPDQMVRNVPPVHPPREPYYTGRYEAPPAAYDYNNTLYPSAPLSWSNNNNRSLPMSALYFPTVEPTPPASSMRPLPPRIPMGAVSSSQPLYNNQYSPEPPVMNNLSPICFDTPMNYTSSEAPSHPFMPMQPQPQLPLPSQPTHPPAGFEIPPVCQPGPAPISRNDDLSMSSSASSSTPKIKPSSAPKKKREGSGPMKKIRNPENWKSNVLKMKRLRGESYINRHGNVVPARKLKPKDCSKCTFKCSDKFTEEMRQEIFDAYYGLESHSRQKDFVCQNITEQKTKKYLEPDGSLHANKKKVARKYFLTANGNRQQVCEQFFRATLVIGNGFINHALKNKDGGCYIGKEKRGGIPHNKTPETQVHDVQNHIESVLAVEPHHTTPDGKRILPEGLNVAKMYRMYLGYCQAQNLAPVKCHMYRLLFKKSGVEVVEPQKSGHKSKC